MNKKKVAIILLCLAVLLSCCLAAACSDDSNGDGEMRLVLEYINSSNVIVWKANWAEKFAVSVYFGENEEGYLIYQENDITTSYNHRKLGTYYDQSGKYYIEVTAYKGEYEVKDSVTVDVLVDDDLQNPDDEYQEPDDNQKPDGFKSDVGRLKKIYYHLAKSDDDLQVVLANQNGVKSVSGFTLSQYGDWNYDSDSNSLIIDSVYLKKFSSGARLKFKIEYVDGRNGEIDVELVNELPMDIIKGGMSFTGSQIYSNNINGVISILNLAINYDIFLGYGKEVSDVGSAYYVKNISIDGKRLLSSAYATYSKESKIMLTANKSLSGLSYGMHLLEIYTTHGKSEVWLNVRGTDNSPYNVTIDYDGSYPNVYVQWDMLKDNAEDFIVRIGEKEYGKKDNPQLFDGYKFDATGKIKYGDEVRVGTIIDGREELSLATTLSVNIDNPVVRDYLSYDKSFEYLGTHNNMFIDDYDELKDLVFYSLIHYDILARSNDSNYQKMWKIYVNPSLAGDASTLEKHISSAEKYFNEGVKSIWKVKGGYINIYELHFTVYSTCIPSEVVRSSSIKENIYNDTHFSKTGRKVDFDDFAVNKLTDSAQVTYSEELYLALERGVRPEPKQGSPAQKVYDKAKAILRNIIDDNMNEFQKVHAIIDWLSCYVTYNWTLSDEINKVDASSDEYNKFYAYRELYLEGAILDGLAVCNGYAKAVSLMCGIEGITCYKIKGGSGQGVGIRPNVVYPQHAWNKAYIEGSWYVLDSTWANERYSYGTSFQTNEVHKHNTLFMTEEQSGNKENGAHYEQYLGIYSGYFAGSPYDVFANTFFMYDGNIYDMVIDSQKELEILLEYLANARGRDMGRNTYVTIDVRCDNNLLKQYIDALKKELDLFANYSVSVKYSASYGSMTSLVFAKL